MEIEQYFLQFRRTFSASSTVLIEQITYELRDLDEGYIRGDVTFIDGSRLHVREYIAFDERIIRYTYVYQYMTSDNQLLFRYDNTEHHPNLSTFPHHKHEGSEDNVIASSAPTLAQVLAEIELLVRLS